MEITEKSGIDKKRELYLNQKATLDLFLERGAITKAQYDKSFGDLTEKWDMPTKETNRSEIMVKHIILWKLKSEFSETEKDNIISGIREGLEGLEGKIDGLKEIKVISGGLPSSSADLMLYSVFEDEKSLKGYAVNPLHVAVAENHVRPFVETRLALDFPVL